MFNSKVNIKVSCQGISAKEFINKIIFMEEFMSNIDIRSG